MLTRRAAMLATLAALAPSLARAEEDPRPMTYAMLNRRAPAFELPRLGGGVETLARYRGKALLLTFGGLWCPDCIVDGRNLAHLAARAAGDANVEFLYLQNAPAFGRWGGGVRRSTATLADAERAWRAYFAETGYSFPVAVDMSLELPTARAYAVEWFPSNLIIDRRGRITAWRTDFHSEQAAEAFYEEARRAA
ncbi:TlpA family protein disulfide reductase [Terricaulis sp.]|uniref:TlpA family protein disulfide reductase n=1 Tax=Terricaulis sp. TaxID=2768686 RepID=UPI0037831F49